ncbi:hypothetical protein RFI_37901 [Reticulomyxa filosa]|uniref:Uncharacterized protein n=1 Tax=Reticulomyxa filosa TaxID=46433 RepID=X6LFP8_RETFI|nr:hypothetical protein RFI_37901 [Reticulomyxa filosa]|eukprot:ETN99569.1 hypothetical protein RFI_37901 [Reticulomyxa filosa]
MSSKAFVCLEKKMHEVELISLNFKSFKESILVIINTNKDGNDETKNSTHHFKIVDNNGQEITNDQQLKSAFETQPVFFFIHFIHSFVYYYFSFFYLFESLKLNKKNR